MRTGQWLIIISLLLNTSGAVALAQTKTAEEVCTPVKTYSRSGECLNLIRDAVRLRLLDVGWPTVDFPDKVAVSFYNKRDSNLLRYFIFEPSLAGLMIRKGDVYRVAILFTGSSEFPAEKVLAHEFVHVFQFFNGHIATEFEAETISTRVYSDIFKEKK